MPEIENGIKYFSLLEVMSSVQRTITERYSSAFWVKAEMIKLNYYVHSGHCYPDLVEKSYGKVVAQTRALIWKSDFELIKEKFETITKEQIKDGITILFYCRISFDTLHGLSLRIIDIDPMFSLGELERERRQTISKIKQENLFDKNKKLPLPILPQRLAIISVITSKGYSDFLKIIEQDSNGYKFFIHLFPSLLQGDKATQTIIQALDMIEKVKSHFDAVLIVRGGGGDVGLACYNDYELVKTICKFPLPILTGIGHSTNETVTEMVANKNCITPTELADFLLNHFRGFDKQLSDFKYIITNSSQKRLDSELRKLKDYSNNIKFSSSNILLKEHNKIDTIKNNLLKSSKDSIAKEQKEIENFERVINILDPKNLLKRGYTISFIGNKIITKADNANLGDEIVTLFEDGKIISQVIKKVKN